GTEELGVSAGCGVEQKTGGRSGIARVGVSDEDAFVVESGALNRVGCAGLEKPWVIEHDRVTGGIVQLGWKTRLHHLERIVQRSWRIARSGDDAHSAVRIDDRVGL